MTNANKFKSIFGIYATELWAKSEEEFLEWLNSETKEQKKPCTICENLEKGDTLYVSSDWDGGIGFDYIRDIRFCPVCGRKLKEYGVDMGCEE